MYLIARSSKVFSKDITVCFEKMCFKIGPLKELRISLGEHHKLEGVYICCGHQTLDELYSARLFSRQRTPKASDAHQ